MSSFSADELAAKMPTNWRMQSDAPRILGLSGGVAACLLDGQPGEVSSGASDNHILSLVIKGEQRHRMWRDNRQVWDGPLPSESVNIVTAGQAPRALITTPLRVLHVYIPHRHLTALAETLDLSFRPMSLEIQDPRFAPDNELTNLLHALVAAFDPETPTANIWRESVCQAIAARILHRWSNIGDTAKRKVAIGTVLAPWQLNRLIDKLTTDIDQDVSLDDLARLVGLSPSHLCTAFRQSTGLPPHQWQKQLRIERARELLVDPRLSVTEISLAVGYANPGHFATVFRRATGMTPREWRRQNLRSALSVDDLLSMPDQAGQSMDHTTDRSAAPNNVERGAR